MDIMMILSIGLQIIGGATILLRIVAPLTKTNIDNKVLEVLTKILKVVSLNVKDSKLEIKIK